MSLLGPQFGNQPGRHDPEIQWDRSRPVPRDEDIHPKVAETILESTRRMAAEHHRATPDEIKFLNIERNPRYKPGYPSYEEVARSRGYDYPHEVPPWGEMRDYSHEAQASHTVEVSYPERELHYPDWGAEDQTPTVGPKTGRRYNAVYGVNMFEEKRPELWAD